MIKLYIVEDHKLLRDAWKFLISSRKDILIVGESDNIDQAFEEILVLLPEVILLDINLKGRSGIELIRQLKASVPYIKIIVVSMHNEYAFVKKAFAMGINGYISKNANGKNIFEAIDKVMNSQYFISDDLQKIILDRPATDELKNDLTFKEIEVIQFICKGYSNKQLAVGLNCSIKTVEGHKSKIYKKIGIRSQAEIYHFALANGLI